MKAAILKKPGQFVLEDRSIPEMGPNEIRVRTKVCGVCTGELDAWEGKAEELTFPRFIGHEVSGIVEAVGRDVTDVAEGDRVAVYAEGEGYAEQVTVPAAWAVKLADEVPFEHALGEPIACAVNGVRKAAPELGDSVALVGCGFMGLIMLQAFRARGVGSLIAIDRRQDVLDLARQLGATHTFDATEEDVVETVRSLSGGEGVDLGVEAAGVQATLDLTSELVRMEGTLEVFGFHQGAPRKVDWGYWNWMAFRIINGHNRTPAVYVRGMEIGMGMVERGALDMEPLVTHRFGLAGINDAFETASAKKSGFVKGVIEM